jgi:type III secretion protein N (ATPase)
MNIFEVFADEVRSIPPLQLQSTVREITGPVVKAELVAAAVGDIVRVERRNSDRPSLAQVVGFNRESLILSVFGPTQDILPGATVHVLRQRHRLELSGRLCGSVLDAMGNILHAGEGRKFDIPPLSTTPDHPAPPALERLPIRKIFATGLRSIDGFITLGCGQRMCILAQPGVGKSSLLSAIAQTSSADVNVIALIGERGREIGEFLNETLSAETRQKTVVVVSTSDQEPLLRVTAADTATRIAEYFRFHGMNVLLQVDSLTRYLRALREVGLAAGEIPVRRGYPPSIFSRLPRLIERCGTAASGSITALYTVLLSSDLDEDPMVDELKGLTDGHITLSKELADAGHYPAIDINRSLSRLADKLLGEAEKDASQRLRGVLAKVEKDRELVRLGAAADEEFTAAVQVESELKRFLRQRPGENSDLPTTLAQLGNLAALLENRSPA